MNIKCTLDKQLIKTEAEPLILVKVIRTTQMQSRNAITEIVVITVIDLIILWIRQEILKTDKEDVKLRYFRSTTIHDMKYDVKAILKKEPDFIIIFVGTSNTAI